MAFISFDPTKKKTGTETKKGNDFWIKGQGAQDNIFIIAPGIDSLGFDAETFYQYYRTHRGYSAPHPANPEWKLRPQFVCVQDKRFDKMLTRCPECDLIEVNTVKLKSLKEQEKELSVSTTLTDEEVENLEAVKSEINALEDFLGKSTEAFKAGLGHTTISEYLCYAKKPDGQWGVLHLNTQAKKALISFIKDSGVENPIAQEAKLLKFVKSGRGLDTSVIVSTVKETVTVSGQKYQKDKTYTLTEQDEEEILKLKSIADYYYKFTSNQVQALVDSNGDPDVVQTVVNSYTKTAPKKESRRLESNVQAEELDEDDLSEESMRKHFATGK